MELAGARFELSAQRSQLAIEKKVSTHLKAKLKVCTLIGIYYLALKLLEISYKSFLFYCTPLLVNFFM